MKTIKVKQFTNENLNEALKLGDPRIKKRVIDLSRYAKECRSAAKKARADGNTDLADALDKRAEELEELVRTSNMDIIDDPKDNEKAPSEKGTSAEDGDQDKGDEADQPDDTDPEQQKDDDSSDADDTEDEDDDFKVDGDNEDKNNSKSHGDKESSDDSDGSSDSNSDSSSEDNGSDEGDENDSDSADGGDEEEADEQDDSSDGDGDGDEEDSDEEDADGDGNGDSDDDSDSDDDADDKGKSKGSSSSSSSDDDDDSDDDTSDSEDDPINDVFADEEDIPNLPIGQSDKQPRDPTIDELIKQLKGLKGEAKRGAIQALKDLLAGRKAPKDESLTKQSLTEAIKKTVREMEDEEYEDLVNDTIDLINKVKQTTEVDPKERKERIDQWQNDPLTRDELDAEDSAAVKDEKRAIKAHQAEVNKYSQFDTMSEFELDFYDTIKDQVAEVLQTFLTYDEIDPFDDDEGIIAKAEVSKIIPEEAIPSIDVYFDRSGSWNSSHTAVGKRAIATVKQKFVDKGLCTMNIFYFDDIVTTDEHDWRLGRGSTDAWPLILQNIVDTGARNVLIMTDHDMDVDAVNLGKTVYIEGTVWWLWKDNKSAQNCVKHLRGRGGSFQYGFSV